jgi:8-oxo-dGTP pyrophosphatase MutT (NUDIX family)
MLVAVRSFLPSTDFYLAAGTVTIDPVERKVLIIHDIPTNTFQLPRGRKDWGENLAETAVRETFEETGCRPRLLAVPLSTRATVPQAALTDSTHPAHAAARLARFDEETGDLLVAGTARLAEEPIALMLHYQANGALAVVSWYVGVADSHSQRRLGTQMADEEYEPRWVGYDEAVSLMVDRAYADVVTCAVRLVTQVADEDGAPAVLAGRPSTSDVNCGLARDAARGGTVVCHSNEADSMHPTLLQPHGGILEASSRAALDAKPAIHKVTLISDGPDGHQGNSQFSPGCVGADRHLPVENI